jgi:multidrug efflux pump subunit AcrB
MLIGAALLPMQNIGLKPSRSLPSLTVSYTWADAAALVIEQEVTSKLEGVLNSIKGLKEIKSVSKKESGSISLEFKKNTNMDAVRFEAATLIRMIYPKLPAGVSYPEISANTDRENEQAIVIYQLNGNESPFFIQNYAENHILPKLSHLQGIKNIKVFGATPYEWEISYEHKKMNALNIRVDEIISALKNYFAEYTVGSGNLHVEGLNYTPKLKVVLKNAIPDSLNWQIIPVKKINNRIIYLGDIATVRYKEQKPHSYFRINGLNAINIVFYPEANVNMIKLAGSITKQMSRINQNLPAGYSLRLSYDASKDIAKEIRKISIRALFSLVILLIFVLITSRNIRYLWIILISLTANLLIAVIFYYALNLEIHLYSLAGITISFGIIIDNSIMMIHHYHQYKNLKVFLSIFAATLTTIASLSIIFFLNENQQINLLDFAYVIIINLTVSLFTALFFVPALMDEIKINIRNGKGSRKRKRRILRISRFYKKSILFSKKYKWLYFAVFILAFGLPVNLLPEKIEKDNFWANIYNHTLGSDWYNSEIREKANKLLGGSFRLFTDYVFENAYYADPQRTVLYARGSMPEGCTVQQMNEAVMKMENILAKYNEIDFYQTAIRSYRDAAISIYFKPDAEKSSFPFYLKEILTSKAINLGGLDWSIYGVGKGFSNALGMGMYNSHIVLEGYNYDQLYDYARLLKKKLESNNRVEEVAIEGRTSWSAKTIHEYLIDFNKELFTLYDIPLSGFYAYLQNNVFRNRIMSIYNKGNLQNVSLSSDIAGIFDVWMLNNEAFVYNKQNYKSSVLAKIIKQKTGNNIYKNNQQYHLVLNYNFIGPELLSKKVRERFINEIKQILPLGYKCEEPTWTWWNKREKKQYFLLFIIILIIYFICSILFESFRQPLTIILMIPISFTGVFFTFYLFDFNFDQGGFASFILLAGIVVNAGIYLINEYNQIKQKQNKNALDIYIKAFNHKIVPIFLTIISTVLGLIPFIYAGQNEVFWFAFAAGSIGGLIFSFIAIFIFLPLFLKLDSNK